MDRFQQTKLSYKETISPLSYEMLLTCFDDLINSYMEASLHSLEVSLTAILLLHIVIVNL